MRLALPRPLRAAFLVTSMPVGGAETLLVDLVRRLDRKQFAPEIICLKERGPLGEMLAAACDMKAMLWRTSPASTELEPVVLDWLRQMMGLPEDFSGLIYDTASISTLHVIAISSC